MSRGPGIRPTSPRSAAAMALAMGLLAAGCSAPRVQIWPSDVGADGILPLAEATPGARVREEGESLLVELRGDVDRVDSRGGHALGAQSLPVLQLRFSFVGVPSRNLWVRVVSDGGPPVTLDVPLRRVEPGEPVEAVVSLVQALGTGHRIDKVGLAIPGGGSLRLHAMRIRPLSARLFLRLARELLSNPFIHEPNVVLLGYGLVLLLLASPWLVARAVLVRRGGGRPSTSRLVKAFAAGVASAWLVMSLPSLDRQARAALAAVESFRVLSPADVKKSTLGLDGYAMAHLVDEHVPPEAPVVLFRSGKPSLASWRLIASLSPRYVLNVGCTASELPPEIHAGVALAGCLAEPVAVVPPPPGPPAERWRVAIPSWPDPWHLRGIAVALHPSTVDPAERISVSLRDGKGNALLERQLGSTASIDIWDVVEVPARTQVRVEIVASRDAGDAAVGLKPGGVQVFRVPSLFTPVAWDPSGAILVHGRGRAIEGSPRPVLVREESPSRLEPLRLLLGVALLVAVGEAIQRCVFRGAAAPSGPERLALAWILGAGVVTLLWHLLELLGLPAWPLTLLVSGLMALAGLLAGRRDPRPPVAPPLAPDEKAMTAAAIAMVAFAMLHAWHEPTREWDELINWGYRAHVFHYAGPTNEAIRRYAALSPRHKAYPPGLPLTEAYATRVLGRWDDAKASIPVSLYYGSMGLLVFSAVRRAGSRRLALLYALLALLGPMARMMSPVGMADLPLGVVLLAAFLCLDAWRGDRDTRGYLLVAGLLGSLLSWIKLDGGALKLLLLGVAALRAAGFLKARPRVLLELLGCAALAFLPLTAWNHVYRSLGLVDWVVNSQTLDPAYLRSKLDVVPEIARALVGDLLVSDWGAGLLWSATYVFLVLAAAAAPWSVFRPASRMWVLALALGITGYGLIYVVSPQGLYQLERSLDRILLHFFPVAVVLAGRLHGILLGQDRRPGGE